MNFRVGQKVVCVDVSDCWDDATKPAEIVEGAVYQIAWVGYYDACQSEGPHVRLVGVSRRNKHFPDWPFRASRFRPVAERGTETGMAILRKIASDITTKITEKV